MATDGNLPGMCYMQHMHSNQMRKNRIVLPVERRHLDLDIFAAGYPPALASKLIAAACFLPSALNSQRPSGQRNEVKVFSSLDINSHAL